MPLDFALGGDISARMDKGAPEGRESVSEFKRRRRRVARATPRSTVVKAVEAMKSRARMIYDADGSDIARD